MPRGGRRPGAGAPKGNFNAMRGGNHSYRLAMVLLRLLLEPDKQAIGWAMVDAGFISPRTGFNEDVRGLTDFLWRRWFDSPGATQSTSISRQPSVSAAALRDLRRQIQNEMARRPYTAHGANFVKTKRQSNRPAAHSGRSLSPLRVAPLRGLDAL